MANLETTKELGLKDFTDIDFEHLLSKYGNEGLHKLGSLLQDYAINDANKAIKNSI